MTVTFTLDLPADLAERIHALPPATLNRYAIATLPGMVDAAEADTAQTGFDADDDEPIDMDFIAELQAADEEAARTNEAQTVLLADLRTQLDNLRGGGGPEFIERLRVRLASDGLTPAQAVGVPSV